MNIFIGSLPFAVKDEALKELDKLESEKGLLEDDIDWYKSEVLRLEYEISNLETKLGDLL